MPGRAPSPNAPVYDLRMHRNRRPELCVELSPKARATVEAATTLTDFPRPLLRTLVCVHEAAHGVMASLQGVEFRKLQVKRTSRTLGELRIDEAWISFLIDTLGSEIGALGVSQIIRVLLAGGIATGGFMHSVHGFVGADEKGRRTPLRFYGDEADVAAAHMIAKESTRTKRAARTLLDGCRAETEEVLCSAAGVDATAEVATQLLRSGTMMPGDVSAAMRSTLGTRGVHEVSVCRR
jgi:hypothetical protein